MIHPRGILAHNSHVAAAHHNNSRLKSRRDCSVWWYSGCGERATAFPPGTAREFVIKETWATSNRATPKSCYPFKKKTNSSKESQNVIIKKNLQKVNATIQKEKLLKKEKSNPKNQKNKSKRQSKKPIKKTSWYEKYLKKQKENKKRKNKQVF